MSAKDTVLELEERKVVRKGLGKLRAGGVVPAVIHDHGQPSVHVQADAVTLAKAYEMAGKNHPLDLKVGDRNFLALIKDVAYKPPKHTLQHVVFQAVKQNEKVEAEVPVTIIGTPPAERVGLLVLHQLDNVLVEAFPRDLPDHFELDSERLSELHDRLTVADLVVPAGVIILTEPEHSIATVVEPRAVAAEEAEAEEGVEGEAGEAAEGEAGETPAEPEAEEFVIT